MRQEIYSKIVDAIRENVPEVKHIDLWNNNVTFIEMEEAWERPAVFVEFAPIGWEPMVGRPAYKGKGRVLVHIVTDWDGQEKADECFKLGDKIAKIVSGLKGDYFHGMEMLTTYTNHNHDELVENIEELAYRCQRQM